MARSPGRDSIREYNPPYCAPLQIKTLNFVRRMGVSEEALDSVDHELNL